jgi:hypothetical protein
MNSFPKSSWQQAADEASGFEGSRINHNCKEHTVLLGNSPVRPDFPLCFLMKNAMHGSLIFSNGVLIEKNLLRYDDVAPDLKEKWGTDRKPNTSCLCFAEGVGLCTYTGASWAVRKAFSAQLLRPYVRVIGLNVFPMVELGFEDGQRDEHGNGVPFFNPVEWVPGARFASIIGEAPTPVAAIEGPPASRAITSGIQRDPRRNTPRDEAPPPTEDDARGGGPAWNDDIPFMCEWR